MLIRPIISTLVLRYINRHNKTCRVLFISVSVIIKLYRIIRMRRIDAAYSY